MTHLLQLIILAAVVTIAATECPFLGWHEFNNTCYWRSSFSLPWKTAASVCDLSFPGSRLVTVPSLGVNQFLTDIVLRGSIAWLGLHRENTTAPWRWTDGALMEWSLWFQGPPTAEGELCGFINVGGDGEWAAAECFCAYTFFMCEIEAS